MKGYSKKLVFSVILTANLVLGIVAQKVDLSGSPEENLKRDSAAMLDAFGKNDFERFADMTDSVSISKIGGRTRLIEMAKAVAIDDTKVFKSLKLVGETPHPIINVATQFLSIVPYRIEGLSQKGHTIVTSACFVGLSADQGANWRFASCTTFYVLYPGFAGKLLIPNEKTTVDGVEQ